ncbi:MAG: PKD domain-containing protein, partial [Flavobacteriales bacterium]
MNSFQTPVCPDKEVSFYGYGDGNEFSWDFGDGNTTKGENVTHSYSSTGTYPISLTLSNGCGDDSTVYDTIKIENDLQVTYANMSIDPDPICPNTIASFNGSGDGDEFSWDFGDGDTANGDFVTHSYNSTGTYKITMTVTNNCGDDSTITDSIEVRNDLNVTDISMDISRDSICPSDTVSISGNGDGVDYSWDFGDGDTASQQYTQHSYSSTGDYPVTLTLKNGCGDDSTITDTVHVSNNTTPEASNLKNFNAIPLKACTGDTIISYASLPGSGDYKWSFGDGYSTTNYTVFQSSAVVKHAYSSTGTYYIKLTYTNSCGNSITDSVQVD